jgi:hypothetical protein
MSQDAETLQEWLQEMEIKKAEAAQKLRLGRRKEQAFRSRDPVNIESN